MKMKWVIKFKGQVFGETDEFEYNGMVENEAINKQRRELMEQCMKANPSGLPGMDFEFELISLDGWSGMREPE